MEKKGFPIKVDFAFFTIYRDAFQRKQDKIPKRKNPQIGDFLQNPSFDEQMREFNEEFERVQKEIEKRFY